MTRRIVLALVLLAAGTFACGGKQGTLTLDIVVSPADDPFVNAKQVRFTIGDASRVKVVPVSGGHFKASLDIDPVATPGPVVVEALDASGAVIAHGQTPSLAVQPISQGPIAVWVGRPGKIAAAATALVAPRSDATGISVPGLGAVFIGGRDDTGAAVTDTSVYFIYSQAITAAAAMNTARAGAGAFSVPTGFAGIVGGSAAIGPGATGMPVANIEVFDAAQPPNGLWTPLTDDPCSMAATMPPCASIARSYANLAALQSTTLLFSGGRDGSGAALASAVFVVPTSGVHITPIGSPMLAARVGHAVAAATFSDGAGAILFGGLTAGQTAPVAERLLGQAFVAYDLPNVPSRSGSTATTLMSGDVLILGGSDASGPLASGFIVHPSVPPTVAMLPAALSTPRSGHTTTVLSSSDLLVCGGVTSGGGVAASCDLLDASGMTIKSSAIPLAIGRTGHVAVQLETGPVVIAGGLDANKMPLMSVEIYTP